MSDWLDLCRQHAGPIDVHFLDAFDRGDTSVGCTDLPGLIARCEADHAGLPAAIVARLSGEVDPAQAAMFARRYQSVWTLAERLPPAEAAFLRIGLVRRTTEVLADSAPRALRVRAVADFFYSVAARILHAATARPFEQAVSDVRWQAVATGVRHGVLTGPGPHGPLSINLLEVRGRSLAVRDCRPGGDLVAEVRRANAVAGVSGGFFLYSEPDIEHPSRRSDPVGLFVHEGQVRNPPVFRRASLVQAHDGRIELGPIGLEGTFVTLDGQRFRIDRVNRPGPGVGAWTRAHTDHAPTRGLQVVGAQVVGIGRAIPLAGLVLEGLPHLVLRSITEALLQVSEAAGTGPDVHWELERPVRMGMAGGPMLLGGAHPLLERHAEDFAGSAPPVTFSQDETYDQNLLPRLAVGQHDDTLLFAAIDGRDLERAPGLTLAGTAELLAALGCETAMNLDGGSSKRMVVRDRVVDNPSTEVVTSGAPTPVRPVHTAILVA